MTRFQISKRRRYSRQVEAWEYGVWAVNAVVVVGCGLIFAAYLGAL